VEEKNIAGIQIVREDANKKFYQLKIYVLLLNMYPGTLRHFTAAHAVRVKHHFLSEES